MIEKNYYHFNPNNNSDDFILSQNTIISKDITKYFKNFQLAAIKFLYKNFETHKACILNDECGLGKTASVAVFLNVILANNQEKRKCLIICKNEERITNWKFHLDILTDLSFKVAFNENEIDDNIVYLTKWESLRSSASLASYKFDCIIVDNRENLMANKICLAYLLRNYENKISLVISNQDVTIDLKEFHSILRLCGRLEQKYRDYKIFEDKFELPLVAGSSSDNQKMLESYFLRREKILNYCKEFCLRRFRHQYESQLPLVSPSVYRLNVKKWQDAPIIAKIKPVNLNMFCNNQRISSFDRDTEDLHNSFINKGNQGQNAENLLNSFFSKTEEDEFNIEVCRITTTITDNAVEQSTEVMSPLVFIPDDSNDNDFGGEDRIDNIVSSTTKDENEVRIIHPMPIHINNKQESLRKANKRKVVRKEISETETDDEPQIVRVTRLTPRTKQDKTSRSGYKELKMSRISTRCQDRVTRSQAHKNKYLTLSIEDTIEEGKRKINEISKNKKKNPKSKEPENNSKPDQSKLKKGSVKSMKSNRNEVKDDETVSTSDNRTKSNASSYTILFNQNFEPVLSSTDSTIDVPKNRTKKKTFSHSQLPLSGLSLLDVQQSDAVHVIESTPELIVLTSSTDSSTYINKNKNFNSFKKSVDKFSKNKTVSSPDIFGSTIDESLNLICSQKSNHIVNTKNIRNIEKHFMKDKKDSYNYSIFDVLEKNTLTENSTKNKCSMDCEIIEQTEKNPRTRTNLINISQNNKITKYLKNDSIQESEKEIVSSSSQSIQSSPLLLVYPKTPKKKKLYKSRKNVNGSRDGSATKPSPTTPTKTPTALTKWLLKSNINNQDLLSQKNDSNTNKDEEITSSRITRSLAVKKRRRLDLSFKD